MLRSGGIGWLARHGAVVAIALGAAALASGHAEPVVAQAAGALGADKRCHVVRTCNFRRGGSYRGCLSSYTCRQCRFVMERCRIGGARGKCRRLKCSWGGR